MSQLLISCINLFIYVEVGRVNPMDHRLWSFGPNNVWPIRYGAVWRRQPGERTPVEVRSFCTSPVFCARSFLKFYDIMKTSKSQNQ